MNLFLAILLIYSFLLIGLGLRLSRSISSSLDFYVASRELGPGLIFSTLLAANIGAGSTVGAAGLGYRLGLSGWWWVGSAAVGSALLAVGVGTLGIGLAIALPSVISALTIFYSFISVTFFAPIILGLFSHSKGGSCVAATIVAVLTTSILHLLTSGNGIWIFSPTTSGLIVSTLILSWTLRR